MNGTELAFSPDGTQILGRSNPGSALDGWFVMDIESGESTPLDVPKDAARLLAAGRAALIADVTAAGPPGGGYPRFASDASHASRSSGLGPERGRFGGSSPIGW